jgi:hypothetical protein
VAVIGAGMSGAACAGVLRAAGVGVDLYERGRAPGGRLAAPTLHGRRVDLGAAYFTVSDDGFADVVSQWSAAGLAREWTDTLGVLNDAARSSSSGPMRWAAPDGLRSLVRTMLDEVTVGREVVSLDELDHDVVVLAMPDPQAQRLAGDAVDWVGYDPVVAVAAGWSRREWGFDAAFVNDDDDLAFVADDGSRRGDGAHVLVLHTTPQRARQHLDNPDTAVVPALAALARVAGVDTAPQWTHAHRWTFAKPAATHDAPFELTEIGGRRVAVCGDSWCPEGSPRVEAAWLSGHRLGLALTSANGTAHLG